MSLSTAGSSAGVLNPCGFLVIDKPAGLTSHACVAHVRRAYGLRRVGHGGTLDPAVTGVLPIAVGPATRLLPYLAGAKAYRGIVQLGLRTDSDDLQGTVLAQQPVPPLDGPALEQALAPFRGAILQVPPQVSAVHVDGERAYARARRGEASVLEPRPVTIESLTLLGWDPGTGRLELEVRCSAEALGFDLASAVPLESLAPPPPLLDPLQALGNLPRQQLEPAQLTPWRCGQSLASVEPHPQGQPLAMLDPDGNLAGIALADGAGWLRPRLVFDAAG